MTGFFHLLYVLELQFPTFYQSSAFKFWISESHLLRWIEYSLTATTISIAAVFGSGSRSLSLFVALWVALPATQLCGYAIECIVHYRKRYAFDQAIEWLLFVIGWFPQAAAFVVVAVNLSFGNSGDVLVGDDLKSEQFDAWKLQGILFFVSFTFFPLIMVLWMTNVIAKFWFAEITYIYGSFSAKTSLFWLIVSTLQEYLEEFNAVPVTGVNWTAVRWSMGVAIPLTIDLVLPLLTRYVFLKREYEDAHDYHSVHNNVQGQIAKPHLRKRVYNVPVLEF